MYVKVLTTFQHHHVAQAVHDYWITHRATVRARSIQVISQFRAGHTDDFREYVKELVCRGFSFILPSTDVLF
jgi:hypothetical protein